MKSLFWIQLQKLKYTSFFKEITQLKKQTLVFTPNPEILLNAREDADFATALKKADFLTIDGIGIYIWLQIQENSYGVFANTFLLPYFIFNIFFRRKSLYRKYGERICGSDITLDLLDFSEKNNIKISIIDPYFPQDKAKCESQKNFEKNVLKVYPNLDFDFFVYNPDKVSNIVEDIKNSQSQILFSTLGMKKQEYSVIDVMNKCPNIKLGLWVGSSFDYVVGFQKRAPKFWRMIWFEWLYRIFTGPQKIKRLKRIYKALIEFPITILKEK